MQYALGALAFVFFIGSDVGDLYLTSRFYKFLFPLGGLTLLGTFIRLCAVSVKFFSFTAFWAAVFVLLALGFLALLVYTLFFAIPLRPTYLDNSAQRRFACDTGVYALCRHPGVLWLLLCLLFAGLAAGSPAAIGFSLYISALNVLYVALQDRYIFPKLFSNYSAYQQTTPFLIPSVRSTRRCFETLSTKRSSI